MPFKDRKLNQGTEAEYANDGKPLMGNSKQLQYICDKMKNDFRKRLFAISVSRTHVCFPNYKKHQGYEDERSVATAAKSRKTKLAT